jgi:hypothetical protein
LGQKDENVLDNLAAGPLETLLVRHGRDIIDRVENEAKSDPRFKDLLLGVWGNAVDATVWERLEALFAAERMNYGDGQEVRLGDRVKLGADDGGVVVASIDSGEYSEAHPAAQWAYLKKGVMVEFPTYGLIHYEEAEPDLQLIERASQPPPGK